MEPTSRQIKKTLRKFRNIHRVNTFTRSEQLDNNWLYNQRMTEVEAYRIEHFTKKQINSQLF